MKFTLPISPAYVSHWGLWEAIREIYQNALDAQTEDPANKAQLEYSPEDRRLMIRTAKGKLSPSSLVLGNTSKSGDSAQRGKFGEGYKLALLVLTRLNHPVVIQMDEEIWYARIEHDATFDSPVLTIQVIPANPHPGIEFSISNVTEDAAANIMGNLYFGGHNEILDAESQAGRIYVGGLYVATLPEFQCGYSFTPETIKLDRDRGMVNNFDLSYETSKLHTLRGGEKALALLEEEEPDVRYVTCHALVSSPLVMHQSAAYLNQHGRSTVPVSTQDEIQSATRAGLSWVLVKDSVKSLLHLVHRWFVPITKSPVELLREFQEKYRYQLNADMQKDLAEIIELMDPQPLPVPVL